MGTTFGPVAVTDADVGQTQNIIITEERARDSLQSHRNRDFSRCSIPRYSTLRELTHSHWR